MTNQITKAIEKSEKEFFENVGYLISTSSPENFTKVKAHLNQSLKSVLEGVVAEIDDGIKDGEDTILAIQNAVRREIVQDIKAIIEDNIKEI